MPQGVPPDYPDRIKALRVRLSLTQVRLAEQMGVSFASVNRWENGQSRPSPLAWQQIVRAEQRGMDGLGATPGSRFAVRETAATYFVEPAGVPDLDFLADCEKVRAVAEAERLAYGHLFNPAFATETSLIDPLPHQRIAVYDRMLPQPRLRFLLADDAGAGKTIMAGLYVREMLSRRLIRRVLVVPPAGLVGNWERELRTLFNLSFTIVLGGDARSSNPFVGPDSDLIIVSVDTLAADRAFARLQEAAVHPYDLVIFDEAHKLSADRELDVRVRKTDRYRLAEALGGVPGPEPRWQLGWSANHLLLLTATPHMGKDYPYYALWRLLEPEALATIDAFNAYPDDARRRHFVRRTKEEMVRFDGTPIYPTRVSDTLSYDLTQGETSEQTLYDETTSYIQTYYNRARILNRSAARLAMSVFQRRLASSTYALLRSFERRLAKLDRLIDDIRSGRVTSEQLAAAQRRLDDVPDVFDEKTADEEAAEDGREENEVVEERAAGAFVARSLAELEAERLQVERLVGLARRVYDQGEESKFDKLREVLRNPAYADEKLIVFTEHRDTLWFLVRRLEGLGFTGQIAQIHGAMDYREREAQVEFFRKPLDQSGARYLVATDAAGEGINLQFCWLMVNYDIPWNPARLEQRMGRIHRYGQKHDPVVIINLVAGKTREGRVLRTLLQKLEAIRKELGSDKVFDVIGRLFEGVSLAEFLTQALDEAGAEEAGRRIEGTLTAAQVRALQAKEQRLLGDGGDVTTELPALKRRLEGEELRRLLPGYVRQFIARAMPLLGIRVEGDLDEIFALRPETTGALDPIWPVLEAYPPERRERLTVYRPRNGDAVIFLHPGEPVFERLRSWVLQRFGREALRGAVFVDPNAEQPYLFHLALVQVERQPDLAFPSLNQGEVLEYRLVGLRQEDDGPISVCPVEYLLLLRGGSRIPVSAARFAVGANELRDAARAYAMSDVATPLAERHRQVILGDLDARADFVARGYDYQDAELAAVRTKLTERARAGDTWATGELTRVKERQRALAARRGNALTILRREPELVAAGEVTFLAHALVVPSSDPGDHTRHDQEVERVAVRVARAYEEGLGAVVRDVSTPDLARAAGLEDHPGFDLLSRRPDGGELAIEVKGRAGIGDVELKENEWAKACNLGQRYWLYVVYDCASAHPRLLRVQNPFRKLIVRAKGGVGVGEQAVFANAE
ncbi:MAG TPA: helicase-related protein [Chloroflexota bacterium]|nr:helicase-related protein [Chloroflexota bacterium]